jgi:hypothetical protein
MGSSLLGPEKGRPWFCPPRFGGKTVRDEGALLRRVTLESVGGRPGVPHISYREESFILTYLKQVARMAKAGIEAAVLNEDTSLKAISQATAPGEGETLQRSRFELMKLEGHPSMPPGPRTGSHAINGTLWYSPTFLRILTLTPQHMAPPMRKWTTSWQVW